MPSHYTNAKRVYFIYCLDQPAWPAGTPFPWGIPLTTHKTNNMTIDGQAPKPGDVFDYAGCGQGGQSCHVKVAYVLPPVTQNTFRNYISSNDFCNIPMLPKWVLMNPLINPSLILNTLADERGKTPGTISPPFSPTTEPTSKSKPNEIDPSETDVQY